MLRLALAAAVLALAPAAAVAQKVAKKPPADGAAFKLSPAAPKYVTADVEFRDPTDAKWPNFFYGKPAADGTFTYSAKQPGGTFTLLCDKMAQKTGDQSRRVLGGIAPEGTVPAVTFTLTGCGPVAANPAAAKNAPKEQFPVKGTLVVGGKSVSVAGTGTWRWSYGKDGEFPESVQLAFAFPVKGQDLGVPLDTVAVTVSVVAYKELPAGKKK